MQLTRGKGVVALLALSLLVPMTANAAPSDSVEAQIAAVELELAGLMSQVSAAEVDAAYAAELHLQAEDALATARADATAAQARADESDRQLDDARAELGALARQAYQGGSTSVGPLTPFFSADPEAALGASTYLGQLSARSDAEVRSFEALAAVNDVLQAEADQALAAEVQALADLQQAADDAGVRVTESATAVQRAEERREQLITQLAGLRNTTVADERARQDEIERAARETQELIARDEALRAPVAAPAAPAPTPQPEQASPAPAPTPTPSSPIPAAPAPAAPVAPVIQPASGTYYATTKLNIRSGPGSTYPLVGSVAVNSTVEVTGTVDGWFQIGTDQWVSGTYLRAGTPPEPTPVQLPSAPATPGSSGIEAVIEFALAQVGDEYVYAATGPDAWDCSGLTRGAYMQMGITLPRSSRSQYLVGTQVPLAEARRGDLLFWSNDGTQEGIYHVALYLGGNMKVHARAPGWGVQHDAVFYNNIMPMVVRLAG